ncbi:MULTISPECIES: putative cell wall binding protein [unclassified Clostridium]|uniref:putative cell wall binding protein n=1 Tax=unclassified Clostridium TaxID=2614128 RepID=UPI000297DBD0|nr:MULTISPECIES: putative cell wall binding protein [unclassified Clostridium]EKQ52670.1 MAG: putative cell wall binding protein [Clostridium sp. Maddingley MBC34-26]
MRNKLIKKIITLTVATITAIGMLSIGASASWRQDSQGWWNSKVNGYSVGWDKVGDKWFYFNPDGYMRTGWLNDGGKWYYLKSNGDMATGWIQDRGKWYYLNQSGDMLFNAFIAGYRLGADGAWIDSDFTNVTTGGAVTVTTGPAVTITDPAANTTAGTAITLPANNYYNYWNQYNNDKNKLDKLAYKYQQKLDEQAQKMQQKLNQSWWYWRR